jgi:hypothetical protein
MLPPVHGSALEVMYMCRQIRNMFYHENSMEMMTQCQWLQTPLCILDTWRENEYTTFHCFDCVAVKYHFGQVLVRLMQPEYSLVNLKTEPHHPLIANYEMDFLMNTLRCLKEKVGLKEYTLYNRQNVDQNYSWPGAQINFKTSQILVEYDLQ